MLVTFRLALLDLEPCGNVIIESECDAHASWCYTESHEADRVR